MVDLIESDDAVEATTAPGEIPKLKHPPIPIGACPEPWQA